MQGHDNDDERLIFYYNLGTPRQHLSKTSSLHKMLNWEEYRIGYLTLYSLAICWSLLEATSPQRLGTGLVQGASGLARLRRQVLDRVPPKRQRSRRGRPSRGK